MIDIVRSLVVAVLGLALATASETGLAPEDSPFRAVQDAVARGDLGRATALLAALPMPPPGDPEFASVAAKAALLGAAAAPEAERARRFLGVAGTYSSREEGLTALVAALASSDAADLATAAAPLADAWRARRDGDPRVALASALLERALAGPVEDGGAALRLRSGTTLPVPQPLAEPMRVRLHRIDSIAAAVDSILEGAAPPSALALDVRVDPKDDAETVLPAPGPGDYLLEVRSLESLWRSFRRIRVSDLDVVAHAAPGGCVVLATMGDRPAAGVEIGVRERGGAAPSRAVTGADGLARLALGRAPAAARRLGFEAETVDAQGARHRASFALDAAGAPVALPELTGHLLIDRPLYRPGETIRGRLAVRRSDPRRIGAVEDAFEPAAQPLAERSVRIDLRLGGEPPRSVFGTTDDAGVAAFEFPLGAGVPPGPFSIDARVVARSRDEFAGGETSPDGGFFVGVGDGVQGEIAEFRRPPLLLACRSPREWRRGAGGDPEIAIAATFPSGVPAAGTAGRVKATVGSLVHDEPFVLDARGAARARLRLGEMSAASGWVSWEASLTAPDGQILVERGSISIVEDAAPPPPPAAPRPPESGVRVTLPPGPVSAGEPVAIAIEGPPGRTVLVSVVREAIFASRSVTLDASGRAAVDVFVEESWYPRVGLLASLSGASERERNPWIHLFGEIGPWLSVRRPEETLELELENAGDAFSPGEEAVLTIVTRDSAGEGVPASVAMAIVDETLYGLREDRTPDPVRALRPDWLREAVRAHGSPAPGSPWSAIGERLRDGRVPAAAGAVEWIGAGGGADGAYGGKSAFDRATPRSEFRPTAFFAPAIRTDADGRASVRFRFPDDLTTWRVTLVAVAARPGLGAALARESVRTARDVSIEPVLPRLVRTGDRVSVRARVSQDPAAQPIAARTSAGAEGALRLSGGGGGAPRDFETRPGAAVDATFEIAGGEPGEGLFAIDLVRAADGGPLDRVRRAVPVASAEAVRSSMASALLEGRTALEPAWIDGARPAGFAVEILASADALLRGAATYLEEYPHGCAEQTASRLVPLFVARHARLSIGGEGRASLEPGDAHRLEVGLARLRALQTADGGFAWWDGSSASDPWITANVFRALALAREAGLDPGKYGIRVREDLPVFAAATVEDAPLPEEEDDEDERRRVVAAADIAASALLLFPASAAHRETCARVAARAAAGEDGWPEGLVARAARALALAGEATAARAALDALLARRFEKAGDATGGLADESPGARAAALLDLVLAARPEDPARARLVAEILRLARGGRLDHTSATAAAVIALSRDRAMRGGEPAASGDVTVSVEADGAVRSVSTRDAARVELPAGTRRVVVSAPAGAPPVVATATALFAEDAAGARPVAEPIAVERRFLLLEPRGDGRLSERPLGGRARVGDLVEAVVTVAGPARLPYVLVECPVPAGFEVVPTSPALVVRDDRVSVGLPRLDAAGGAVVRVRFVAAMAGDVLAPPATAEAMYAPELRGRSAGERLVTSPAESAPGASPEARDLLGAEVAASRLARLESDLATDADPLPVLSALAAFPDEGARRFLFDDAPRALGARLVPQRTMQAYVSALGPRRDARFTGAALAGFLEAADGRGDSARIALARSLAAHRRGETFALRFLRGEGTDEDRRLGALALVEFGSYPAGVDELAAALRLLADDPLLGDAAVRAERGAAFLPRKNDWHDRPRTLCVDPARAALLSLFRRGGGVAASVPIDRARLESVRRLVASAVAAWLEASPEARLAWTDEVGDLLSLAAWPAASGAREPLAHARFREDLRHLRDRVTEVLLSAPAFEPRHARLALDDRAGADLAATAARVLDRLSAGPIVEATDGERLAAGETVLARAAAVRGSPELRTPALVLLGDGPRRWREGAWDLLSDADRKSVPDAVLLAAAADDPDAGWAALELLDRGGEAALGLVRLAAALPRGDVREVAAIRADRTVVGALPLGEVVSLAAALDPRVEPRAAARRRFADRLASGAFADATLAREFAARRDPGERYVLARVLADRGIEPAFEEDDPAAERWRTLVRARRGDAAGGDAVRAFCRDEKAPEIERVNELSFLAPHAREGDLRLEIFGVLPAEDALAAVRSVGAASAASVVLEAALDADSRRALLGAMPDRDVAREVLPRLGAADALVATDLLEALRPRAPLRRAAAEALSDHADAEVREAAAWTLFDETGLEGRFTSASGEPVTVGARTPSERRAAARRRARDGGVAALEGDVEGLSALGLFLSP